MTGLVTSELAGPEPAGPVPVPFGGVAVVGVALVPFDAAELDACELGVEGVVPADLGADPVALGFVVLVGVGNVLVGDQDELAQGGPVVLDAFVLRGALMLEVADAAVFALLLAPLLLPPLLVAALPVGVPVGLAGVPVPLTLELGPPLAGLLLVPLARLDTGGAAGAGAMLVGVDLFTLVAAGAEVAEEHVVAVALTWPMAVLPWPPPGCDEPCRVPGPVCCCGPLVLPEVIPTCWPIWTMASRVGGNARATPTANTAQAIARAGRSSPSRQSRRSPDASGRRSCCPPCPASCSPRPVFQRRTRPARKPPAAADPAECLLA